MNILLDNGLGSVTVLMAAGENTAMIKTAAKEITVEQDLSDSANVSIGGSAEIIGGVDVNTEVNKEETDTSTGDKDATDEESNTDEETNKEETDKSQEEDSNTDNVDNVDTPAVDDQTGQDVSLDSGADVSTDSGATGDMGMTGGMGMDGELGTETTKDPLLSSWPTVIGISGATLLLGAVIGVLLAKKKIKKGFEIYED